MLHEHEEKWLPAVDLMPYLVSLSEHILTQPYAHRCVACFEKLHLHAANGNTSLCLAAIHYFGEGLFLALALDCARGHSEPGGQLLIRTLKAAQLLQFRQINLRRRSPLRHLFACLHSLSSASTNS